MPEFITFVSVPGKGKTMIFNVVNKAYGTVLGIIKWHGAWRKYVFFPGSDMLFDAGCLADIEHFLRALMAARKARKPKR